MSGKGKKGRPGKQGRSSQSAAIPEEVRAQASERIERVNREELHDHGVQYVPRFQGAYLYLDRSELGGRPTPMCRLKYTGDMEKWDFAIYKYSSNSYDANEWFFPGSELADGTIEGAIEATLEAYPG
jgi:hypothetical protein